jgi:glycerol-1-phosphate dehydrogenase [NAD(P)+]
MTTHHDLSDPTDLEGLRRYIKAHDAEQRLAALEMVRVEISEDAHLKVGPAVTDALAAFGKNGRASVVILTDKTAIMRRGQRLSQLVEAQLSSAHDLRVVVLDDGHATLHADEATLDKATEAVRGADLVVTIGSGTMTDVGKVATQRNGGVPQVAVQTAASVDGFTDNVSVVLRNGVKRTVPSRWPTIVLADVVTIGEAPRELNTSGFGEAISLFTAPADWYLANLIGLDSTFHPVSMTLLKAAAAEPPRWSGGVATGEPSAIRHLSRVLALRGIVSGISNTTACLSGVEHVISHMLDVHHASHHQPIGLHGAQVGVASLVATRLWRRAIETDLIKPGLLRKPDAAKMQARVNKAFGTLGRDGAIAAECWRDGQKKMELLEANWSKVVSVVQDWSTHCAEFRRMVQPAETLRVALAASGSPASFPALSPSISPTLSRWAVSNCHLLRNRFNLVDLLDLMGQWTDDLIDWAMADVVAADGPESRGAAR